MKFIKGCLLPFSLTVFGGYWLIALVLTIYSEVFGGAAKNRAFIKGNQSLASESVDLCRAVEQDLLEDMRKNYRTKHLFNSEAYRLKPSGFDSIRFYRVFRRELKLDN